MLHNQNTIGITDSREAVGDGKNGATFHQVVERGLELCLRARALECAIDSVLDKEEGRATLGEAQAGFEGIPLERRSGTICGQSGWYYRPTSTTRHRRCESAESAA